jgi:hypothetical protein
MGLYSTGVQGAQIRIVSMSKTTQPACPKCNKDVFELRMLKDEAVAAVRCVACQRHFLLLDSADYWFDVIQQAYPRLTRCSCKGESFRPSFAYEFRDDGDVSHVWISTTCAGCGKEQRRMSIEIDYSPTKQLVAKPLVPCKNPEILYDLHELTLYATPADMVRVTDHLAEQGCSFVGVVRIDDDWVTKKLTKKEVAALIGKRGEMPAYLQLYAAPKAVSLTDSAVSTAKKEDAFWKRSEVIRIDSPFNMGIGNRAALLYYIHFSNELVDGEAVKSKSGRFRMLTGELVDWLGREFVNWRGKDCFDNEQVHRRLFGNEFRAKAARRRG